MHKLFTMGACVIGALALPTWAITNFGGNTRRQLERITQMALASRRAP